MSHNTVKHSNAKISVNTFECQVSQGDTTGEVVEH